MLELKHIRYVVHEDGEDLLSTLDSEEEAEKIYELFMENLFDDEE